MPNNENVNPENAENNEQANEPSIQDLMNQIATLKRAVDKSSSEAADYKKKWRETLSATEQASQEKAEAAAAEAERVKALERKVAIYDYEKQYSALGYSPEDASKAATLQFDGDTEGLFKLQRDIQSARDAQLRESIEKEIYKNIPDPNMGHGKVDDDPFLKGFTSVPSPYRH